MGLAAACLVAFAILLAVAGVMWCTAWSTRRVGLQAERSRATATLTTIPARTRHSADTVPQVIYTSLRDAGSFPADKRRHWNELHPLWEVRVFGDDECREFIRTNYGSEHAGWFSSLRDGPIRADYFRVLVLLARGGVWLDADAGLLQSIEPYARLATGGRVVSCASHFHYEGPDSVRLFEVFGVDVSAETRMYNPMFIAAMPSDPFLAACAAVYEELFRSNHPYSYWGYSIVHVFAVVRYARKKRYDVQAPMTALVEHCPTSDDNDCFLASATTGELVMMNRTPDYDSHRHRFKTSDETCVVS